ncbi:MAG: hypothetical protein AB1796_15320 [Bacillota bacterium]
MLSAQIDLREMDAIIKEVKAGILKLMELSGGMQCVDRNCERILAGIKMLEINVSDLQDVME